MESNYCLRSIPFSLHNAFTPSLNVNLFNIFNNSPLLISPVNSAPIFILSALDFMDTGLNTDENVESSDAPRVCMKHWLNIFETVWHENLLELNTFFDVLI